MQPATHSVSESSQEGNNAVISDDSKVLLVLGNLGDGSTHTGQDLSVGRLEETHYQLQTAHKRPHKLSRILCMFDAWTYGPGSTRLHLQRYPEKRAVLTASYSTPLDTMGICLKQAKTDV